ncbi:uncharacterized protein MELLADRAFT_124541 [Melampsora larici-populina 98AG31]|uniref:Secreted protein n=1 Tax=Melampsora larici-populina (strain 98AG31 / pathotype 3-4-7) TaxID=747676 RepID=F4RP92_MELLP|nr:uncharacterized protein MELLADRAFT_124541 [Melampsora larici-populina 98AG31]EGG05890.1 secreted protein [Melampsora larici-populina 98AG31]
MLFFKIIIAAVLAATISARRVQVDQTVTCEALQQQYVEFTPIIEKRLSRLLKTCQYGPGNKPPVCWTECESGPGCC